MNDSPARTPTTDEINICHRDSAVLLKQMLPDKKVELLAQGLEEARLNTDLLIKSVIKWLR